LEQARSSAGLVTGILAVCGALVYRARVGVGYTRCAIEGYVKEGEEYTYDKHGFVATAYDLPTDQYGTQLDPPAHWEPLGATISDLPATYAIRPLVVINIADLVGKDPGYRFSEI